jgi:F0F1-type ATP synthase assembly protein I
MNQTTYARGSDATDSDPPHRRTTDVLKAAVDWLVASVGLVLLGLGAFWMFAGRLDSLPWLLVGGLLLIADAGVTTRLRVVRLEAQMCDERSAVSTR